MQTEDQSAVEKFFKRAKEGGELVYARNDLKAPFHLLEEPLHTATQYLWTVCARFMIDDRIQLTEWGLGG